MLGSIPGPTLNRLSHPGVPVNSVLHRVARKKLGRSKLLRPRTSMVGQAEWGGQVYWENLLASGTDLSSAVGHCPGKAYGISTESQSHL